MHRLGMLKLDFATRFGMLVAYQVLGLWHGKVSKPVKAVLH